MSNVVCVFFFLVLRVGTLESYCYPFLWPGIDYDLLYHIIRGIAISHARIELITTQIEAQNTQAWFVQGKNA
jgi:hypothetical protein